MLRKIEYRKRRRQQWIRWLDGIIDSMDMSLSKLREIVKPGILQFMESQRTGHDLATEQQEILEQFTFNLCNLWFTLIIYNNNQATERHLSYGIEFFIMKISLWLSTTSEKLFSRKLVESLLERQCWKGLKGSVMWTSWGRKVMQGYKLYQRFQWEISGNKPFTKAFRNALDGWAPPSLFTGHKLG